jgi:glycerol transport system ATP-binding protein
VSLTQTARHTIAVHALVGTSEITGSETYMHVSVEMGGGKVHWVVLTHGVHRVNNGDAITLYLDPSRYYLFAGSDGSLSRAPSLNAKAA